MISQRPVPWSLPTLLSLVQAITHAQAIKQWETAQIRDSSLQDGVESAPNTRRVPLSLISPEKKT